ncbi:ABC-type transport system involved in Fe-S cluster assembly fused permease/ATPase subunit [Pseudarthrobacter sp. PvP004]|nr:ABC-type transport system involved in Fe-S cluster assembly fused permease/ATPase subunit [Pseudarthrobacter sp. PvP004]
MKMKWLLSTVLLLICIAIAVWILSGSTDIWPALIVVVGVVVAANFAVQWGGSKARDNQQAMNDLLSRNRSKPPTPNDE